MRRMVNWPYWPEITIVAAWQFLVVPVNTIWQMELAQLPLVALAVYWLIGKPIVTKMAMRREYG